MILQLDDGTTREVNVKIVAEVSKAIQDNADASIRALERNDMVAYRALAEQEARLMDVFKVAGGFTR